MSEPRVADELRASKKYRDVAPEALSRTMERELAARKNVREAVKAAKTALHQSIGAFAEDFDLKNARALMAEYLAGDSQALDKCLVMHASTRERLEAADELYGELFGETRPTIIDLACGLNPLWLGAHGFQVEGVDAHGALTLLINEWAEACSWPVSARAVDLISGEAALGGASCALMMKLLPLIERQSRGGAKRLLERVRCEARVVTFPTRTLGGRNVGMEENYGRWLADILPENLRVERHFSIPGEAVYVIVEADE